MKKKKKFNRAKYLRAKVTFVQKCPRAKYFRAILYARANFIATPLNGISIFNSIDIYIYIA